MQPYKQRTNPKTGFIAGYQFTVTGSYYAFTEKGTKPRRYAKCKFELPEIVTYVKGRKWQFYEQNGKRKKRSVPDLERANAARVCKHYILRYLLPFYLKETYPEDFKKVRTIQIVTKERMWIDPKHGRDINSIEINKMDVAQLMQFAAVNDLSKEYLTYEDLADQKLVIAEEWQVKKGEIAKLARDMKSTDILLTEPTNLKITNLSITDPGSATEEEASASYGAVTADDGVPVDNQDPFADML